MTVTDGPGPEGVYRAGEGAPLRYATERPPQVTPKTDRGEALELGGLLRHYPRPLGETDRLDTQHHALRAAVKSNYLAPICDPSRILDVGAGTGQWAYDLCREFPRAVVVGVDLESSKPGRPSNYHFVQGNVLHGLALADDSFDFVHQRLMMTAIPLSIWPSAVRELVRVARPGGCIELAEIGDRMAPIGPATSELWELGNRLAASRGLDSTGTVLSRLDEYLLQAGAVDVERHHVAIPVGSWGGAIGSMMASDFRALFMRLYAPIEAHLRIATADCNELLAVAMQECEQYRTNAICTFVHARKPELT